MENPTLDVAPKTPGNDPMCGTLIGEFRIIERLGEGGSGIVYRANQLRVGREVALKILHPELQQNEESVRAFLREVRLASRVEHPNIVQSYDAGKTADGALFFAMEYVRGTTLEAMRRAGSPDLTLARLCEIAIALAGALSYTWKRHKITHGDIKPGNVMIREDGVVKLADLGLARIADGRTTENGEQGVFATPLYASPEVILNVSANIGVASDIYSFGAMLYELLAGVPPFDGDIDIVLHKHLSESPIALAARCDWIPPSLSYFIDLCLRKKIEERPADWDEVKKFFLKLQKELKEEEKAIDRMDHTTGRDTPAAAGIAGILQGWHRWIVPAAAVLVVLVTLLLLISCWLYL